MSFPSTIHAVVFNAIRRWPENLALINRDEKITYAELGKTALRQAAVLGRNCGARSGIIGILSERNSFACTAILSVLAAGKTYVPLNIRYPVEVLKNIATIANLDAIIVGPESIQLAAALLRQAPIRLIFATFPAHDDLQHLGEAVVDLNASTDFEQGAIVLQSCNENAYLLFTSGSTGSPKGVPIPHRAVLAFLEHMQEVYCIAQADRLTHLFDHSFDLSVFDLFMAWSHGACAIILDGSAPDLVDQVRNQQITLWFSVPSVAARLMRAGKLVPGALPTLRYSLFCGEPLYGNIAMAWQQAASNSIIDNLYGPTELTIACSRYRIEKQEGDGILPIGQVFPHLPFAICDETGGPIKEGDIGELCVGGSQMFAGYWKAGHLTEGRFHENAGEKLYRTGDLVKEVDEKLHFIGRRDSQIKLNGYRIELSEIEHALRRAGASEAVAVAWPPGEAPVAIRAIVSGPTPLEIIRGTLAGLLPPQMIPAEIVPIADMPLNENGKIDRQKATALLHPNKTSVDLDALIAEALEISAETIRNEMEIFSVKSWDSLGHARLMLSVEEQFGIPFDRKISDRIRTIGDIRSLIESGTVTAPPPVADPIRKGLVGVVIDRTSIAGINGNQGQLIYRGYAIEELCSRSTFEDVAHLLIAGSLPDDDQRLMVRDAFSRAQNLCTSTRDLVRHCRSLHPTNALTIASAASDIEDPFEMVGYLTAVAGFLNSQNSDMPFQPFFHTAHHERIARYILQRSPSELEVDFLRQDLILHAEHGANASTLALRTAISAGSSLSQAVTAAIMTFAGALHGGAVEGAARMFDRIGSPKNAEGYVASENRVMGFGHRIYKTDDPRAIRLRQLTEELAAEKGNRRDLDIAIGLMDAMQARREKGVGVNVDLFAAVGYRLLGIDDRLGVTLAILGRVAGWCAHACEQRANNVLIRPDLLYEGPPYRSLDGIQS